MKKKAIAFALFTFFTATNGFSKERPIVKDINASHGSGTAISVSWTLPKESDPPLARLFVYRSTKPIGSFYDLNETKPIAELEPDSSSFLDNVKDYRDYYYAVTGEVNGRQFDIILPSINSTVNGVHRKIPETKPEVASFSSEKEKIHSSGSIRETPLPYLYYTEGQNKTPVKMKKEVMDTGKELSKAHKMKSTKISEPYVFEEDLISPDGGDDFLLFEILRDSFIQKKYSKSEEQLKKLISTNRAKSVTERAKFYLGESYYFSGNYREAVLSFLSVYEKYPAVSKKWIDSALDYLEPQ